MTERPNCYECAYRGRVPGDAHSSCKHPSVADAAGDATMNVMAIFAGVSRGPPMQGKNDLNIKGNAHGIRNGWFNWPWNFDPTWLERCDGHTAKQPQTEAQDQHGDQENKR